MYYTYKCPYCGRVYFVYHQNREQASRTLYHSIKQHLIEYDEDHKEYEFDEGEQIESNQIYATMSQSKYPPPGGYEARIHSDTYSTPSPTSPSSPTSSPTSSRSSFGIILFLFLILIIVAVLVYFFSPDILTFINPFAL